MNAVHTTPHSRWANVPFRLFVVGSFLIFLVGFVGSIDSIYELVTGHSISADATPPTIDSAFTSTATCDSTTIVPDAEVKDPGGSLFSRVSGLALVQLYVGGERIGEWPIEKQEHEPPVKVLDFKGLTFARRTTSEHGPVIAVAHDHSGNFFAKELVGAYARPLCFDAALSAKNGCTCRGPTQGQAANEDKKNTTGAGPAQADAKGSAQKPAEEKPPTQTAK